MEVKLDKYNQMKIQYSKVLLLKDFETYWDETQKDVNSLLIFMKAIKFTFGF